MNLVESIRAEVERRALAASTTIVSRVLSMRLSAAKDKIAKHVGVRHYDNSGTDYGRLIARRLEIKLQLRRLGFRSSSTTASMEFDLEFGERRAVAVARLLDEQEEIAALCEAAKKDLFYEG